MYVSKSNAGTPMPFNASLMKKSADDIQMVEGPGYRYYARTVGGDETVVPNKAISAWMWNQITKNVIDGFKSWDTNQTTVKLGEQATSVQQAEIQAGVDTFVPPPAP